MNAATDSASKPAPRMTRGMMLSLGVNIALGLLLCGMALYAFMLNVDLGDIKRQLSKEVETRQKVEAYLVETRNHLTQTLAEVEQLKAQLQYKPSDFQTTPGLKPAMPVVVSFRTSYLGLGQVAVLKNNSDRTLTLVMMVRNPTLSSSHRFTLELGPQASDSFGYFEGWKFASGDEVAIYNNDFNPIKLLVP